MDDAKPQDELSQLKRALVALKAMRARVESMEAARSEPIAIIGMGCRYPGGADDPELFWQKLQDGVDCISEVPADRWDIDAYYDADPDAPGKMNTRWGGFLTQVDQFDPHFFGIAPREAVRMDPQHRLLLEVAWEALENAGQAVDKLNGSPTGVFLGISTSDYASRAMQASVPIDAYAGTGGSSSLAVGRLSYLLGLQGPNFAVDTACSSSLVALHTACQSLRLGECRMALVGGVNVILLPEGTVYFSKVRAMSPSGRCKSFDASADGYVRGEGCGVIVIKRLADALADRDNILAVIRSSALNHDGRSNGLTAPNGNAQRALIRSALAFAGIQPSEIDYVETHGTGTPLGDPIEVEALAEVLGEGRKSDQRLVLGSVKTNIGHLEAAAGLAGLIKLVLALQHEEIPPHLHLKRLNPFINWGHVPIEIATRRTPWLRAERARRGSLSSFGFSGTNAHIILEEAPRTEALDSGPERPLHVLTLSAKTEPALKDLALRYARFLETSTESFANIAFTANAGRSHFEWRMALVAKDSVEARERLLAFASGEWAKGVFSGQCPRAQTPKVAFLFTGQGSQYVGMGRELYETQPEFRRVLDRCDELLRGVLDQPLLSVLYPDEGTPSPIDQTQYTQVALFALECALSELWKSWGIRPDAVMGHSVGEYAAAYRAGVWSFEDGLKAIAQRGRLMQALPAGGKMASISASVDRVERYLKDANLASRAASSGEGMAVSIAAVNGPTDVVISGEGSAVEAILDQFAKEGIEGRVLKVSHAFHSVLMDPMLDAFETAVKDVRLHAPRVHLISNLTGKAARVDDITKPAYWRRHVRERVEFARGIETLNTQDHDVFIEIGPAPVLLGMGQRCIDDERTWLPSLRLGRGDWTQILESVARFYVAGGSVDWEGFDREYSRRRVALPTYPFQRDRYWLDLTVSGETPHRLAAASSAANGAHPLLGTRLRSALRDVLYASEISLEGQPCLADHRVYGHSILPAAAYLEMALTAGTDSMEQPCELRDVTISSPLILKEDEPRAVQTVVRPGESGSAAFEIFSFEEDIDSAGGGRWRLHANGSVGPLPALKPASLEDVRARCREDLDAREFYDRLGQLGMEYGPDFNGAERIWRGDGEVLGAVHLSERPAAEAAHYQIHPALLDAAFQLLAAAAASTSNGDTQEAYLPVGIEAVQVRERGLDRLWVHARVRPQTNDDLIVGDVVLFEDGGRVVGEVQGLTGRRASRTALEQNARSRLSEWIYDVEWSRKEREDQQRDAGFLESPEDIAREVSARFLSLTAEFRVETSQRLSAALEQLSIKYAFVALKDMGFPFEVGAHVSADTLADQLDVAPAHRRLLRRLMGMFEDAGILRSVDAGWQVASVPGTVDMDDAERDWRTLSEEYPECEAELTMFGRCARQLTPVLRGKTDPLQLLFPNGSMAIAERMYGESPGALLMNTLVQQVITKVGERLPGDQKIRMIEVGAGTGGTTAFALRCLPAERADYVFTDVGPLFTSKARTKFAKHKNVRYEVLDIEQDPERQGFRAHQYDVVLAANVVHATRDVKQALRHVRKLLAPGGMLVLVEVTAAARWVDLIFGLTDGWWRFTDTALRPNHPLLAEQAWLDVLSEMGFVDVATIPDEAQRKAFQGQAVILARNASVAQAEPVESDADWLILADSKGIGEGLAETLREEGERCIVARPDDAYARESRDAFRVNPGVAEDVDRLIREAGAVKGVIHLWSIADGTMEPDLEGLRLAQDRGCRSALYLVQALARADGARAPRLWLVSERAQAVYAGDGQVNVAPAPMWGLGRVVSLEHPQFRCVKVDLDLCGNRSEVESTSRWLYEEIRWGDSEDQVALRDGERLVPRLVRNSAAANGSTPMQLQVGTPGQLDSLTLRATSRQAPGSGQVEIRVHAAGMNFRDVLTVLGSYSGDIAALGEECAGEVVSLGPGVEGLRVGDPVVAIAANAFATHALAYAPLVARKPEGLTFEQAATLPIVFVTARYALEHLGQIRKGDRVLIHAAAGGVGLAAVQIALQAGAEVFATAGSAHKRDYLRSMGVSYVMDSRTLTFVQEVMQRTAGTGVDVVLNSLTGDFIPASLSVLAPNGRFLEIGKTGIWEPHRVAAERPDVKYEIVALDRMVVETPALASNLLRDLVDDFDRGRLKALPVRTFPMSAATHAFRYMRKARHIGKIALTVADPQLQVNTMRPDGCYLITGGLGGLGLLIAGWLVERGARHLVLVARSEPSQEAVEQIRSLQRAGAQVRVVQADVAREDAMARLFSDLQSLPPLRGVIHAAGVLDDGVLAHQTWERFEHVMAPKIDGAWNLHRLTRNLSLDFFVLFSSAASIFGSPGQANHAAANAFMDALAHHRREQGLPALSINWGAWGEIGSVVRKNLDKRVGRRGIGNIAPKDGLLCFDQVLGQPQAQLAVVAIDWAVFAAQFPEGKAPPLLTGWSRERTHSAERSSEASTLVKRLATLPEDQRASALCEHIQGLAARVLGLGPSRPVNPQLPLNEMGMDSLMAVELKNHVQVAIGTPLPASVLFDHPTIEQLAAYLVRDVIVFKPEVAVGSGDGVPSAGAAESDAEWNAILGLSDAEAEALLVEERQRLGDAAKKIQTLSATRRELLLMQLASKGGLLRAGATSPVAAREFDLNAEAVLDSEIRPESAVEPGRDVASIFLTGATGYLGGYLLREILEQTDAHVYCLVRASDEMEGRRRLLARLLSLLPAGHGLETRVTAVVGDLSQRNFGLTPDRYRMWAERIDAIYHCGADVNFVRSYPSLKPSTVFGTTEILRFACTGRTKVLHHVSSLAVFGSASKLASSKVIFEDDPLTDSGHPVGYYQSKWVCEKLVMIARERGLPVCIYRPGFITGHSQTGDCKLDDLVPLLIRGFVQLEVAPAPEGAAFDLMPVDHVSRSIVHLSRRADSIGKAFNLANPERILWDRVLDVIGSRGYRIRRVSFESWLEELREAPPENALLQMLPFFERIYETLMTPPTIDNRNVQAGLADAGIPSVKGEELFRVYVDHFLKIGFLPEPSRQPMSAD